MFRNFFWNLILTFKYVFSLPVRERRLSTTAPQILLAWLVATAHMQVINAIWYWPVDTFSNDGLMSVLALNMLAVLAWSFGLILVRRSDAIPQILVAAPFAAIIGQTGVFLIFRYFNDFDSSLVWWSVWALALVPGWIATVRILGRPRLLNVISPAPAVLLNCSILIMSIYYILPTSTLFYKSFDEDVANQFDYPNVDFEEIFYEQDRLMRVQTMPLRQQVPDRPEVYALLIAGFAEQGVFLREVKAVREILGKNYQTMGKTITLANSRAEPLRYPLANFHNIELALGELADRMDHENDLLFVFLTSHGSTDKFSSSFYPINSRDLRAENLARFLDDTGVKNIAVVISACKSGSFIDDLAGPGRLIITAAAESKNSFGCSDANDWTWWGRAFFENALNTNKDFRLAFDDARDLVSSWEIEQGQTPSEPQISIGADVALWLDNYLEN